jgi:hypothetical protein
MDLSDPTTPFVRTVTSPPTLWGNTPKQPARIVLAQAAADYDLRLAGIDATGLRHKDYEPLILAHETRIAALDEIRARIAAQAETEAEKPVSVAEAAEMIGCSPSKVRSLVKSGHLNRLSGMGHAVYIVRRSLDAYLRGER